MVFFFDYNRRLRLPAAFKPRADVREYPGRRPTPKSAKRVRAGHPARARLRIRFYFILAVLASSSAFFTASSARLMRGPTCQTFMRSTRSLL